MKKFISNWWFFLVVMAFNVSLWTYNATRPETVSWTSEPVYVSHLISHTGMEDFTDPFLNEVSDWSVDITSVTPGPAPDKGNCLPVALKLQKLIVDTGRMAILVVTDPTPDDEILHVVVIFDADKDGRFDHIIDNGYSTSHFPRHSSGLYDGNFGKYIGVLRKVAGKYTLSSII